MNKILLTTSLLLMITGSCINKGNISSSSGNDLDGGRISVEGRRFIDASGRQVIFNGVNYVNKDSRSNYIFEDSASVFEQFWQRGFNCIRLGVIWDGVEPEPGKYDENYLDKIELQVKKASELGLYVLLDMHQDLFSISFSDGAPLWATLTDGQPHANGFVWSDSYFMSPAVQRAFDNFWANKPASDGIGIQDHYANMWRHVAKRFTGNNTIIGYDLMNEPFNGSQGTMILPVILKAYAALYAEETGKVYSEEELYGIWGNEESRLNALNWMSDVERYSRVISSATGLSHQFEKNELSSMYQRVADRIREVDTTHILFLEHAYFSNAGVQSGIEPVKDKNGNPDPLVSYAAHGYDLLVDTKYYGKSSNARIEYIFSQISQVAERINRPVLVGEWGAFHGDSEEVTAMAQALMKIFDRHHFSQTYWAYYPGFDKYLFFHKTFGRPFPRFINGILKEVEFNYQTGEFKCSWEESSETGSGTVFFVPELENLVQENISLVPENRNIIIQAMAGSEGGYIIIPASGVKMERSIVLKIRTDISSMPITLRKE